MEKYIGVKIIEAELMNLGDYNEYRGWTIPEDEDPAREGYLVVYPDGYESWSPKEIFEEAYRNIGGKMTFGLAIETMKKGGKVARKGWSGKGMFIFLDIPATSPFSSDGSPKTDPYITMFTAQKSYQSGWLSSQADLLAEDWELVEL